MKRTLVAFAMLPLLLAAACGDGGRSAAGPTATASPAAIAGPLLVYTVGSELVAWDVGGRREVRRTDLEDGPQVELPPGSAEVRIAVAGGDTTSVSAIDPATGAARPVATLPRSYPPSRFLPGSDALSPDGGMLAFSRPVPGAKNPDDREVGVVDIATGGERVLATLPGISDTYRGPASIIGWRDDGRGVLVEGTPGGPPGTWADVMLDGSVIGRLHDYGRASPSGRAVVVDDVNDVGCILGPMQRLRIWDIDANAYSAEVEQAVPDGAWHQGLPSGLRPRQRALVPARRQWRPAHARAGRGRAAPDVEPRARPHLPLPGRKHAGHVGPLRARGFRAFGRWPTGRSIRRSSHPRLDRCTCARARRHSGPLTSRPTSNLQRPTSHGRRPDQRRRPAHAPIACCAHLAYR